MTELTLNQQQRIDEFEDNKKPWGILFTAIIVGLVYFFNLAIIIYIYRDEEIYAIIAMFLIMFCVINPVICAILTMLLLCINEICLAIYNIIKNKVNSLTSNNNDKIM